MANYQYNFRFRHVDRAEITRSIRGVCNTPRMKPVMSDVSNITFPT